LILHIRILVSFLSLFCASVKHHFLFFNIIFIYFAFLVSVSFLIIVLTCSCFYFPFLTFSCLFYLSVFCLYLSIFFSFLFNLSFCTISFISSYNILDIFFYTKYHSFLIFSFFLLIPPNFFIIVITYNFLHIVMKVALFYTKNCSESSIFCIILFHYSPIFTLLR
jgi:hypothetical protein